MLLASSVRNPLVTGEFPSQWTFKEDIREKSWRLSSQCVMIYKSSKRYTNIWWHWNNDKRWHQKKRPHFGWEPPLHLSERWETSIRILTLKPNPKCYGHYKRQYSSLYQLKHSDMSKIQRDFDVICGYISPYHGKHPSESWPSIHIFNAMVNYKCNISTISHFMHTYMKTYNNKSWYFDAKCRINTPWFCRKPRSPLS